MTIYYVATTGSDSGVGSATSPWRTISKAMKASLKSGDEVVVRSGTYNEGVIVNKDGITLRSEVPGGADIVPGEEYGVHINANYIKLDGFDISGSKNSGITAVGVHHVNITNNIVHDNVSNGIFVGRFDFVTIEGNTVYGNAARGASSGIHLKAAYNITGSSSDSGYRVIVRDNVAYGNEWKYGPRTDGNGISLDDFRNTTIPSLPSYTFKTLVDNNIVHSNSGRGIQVAWSDYVTISDNISVLNNADGRSGLWLSELVNMGSNNNTWIGNIAVTDKGNPAIANVSFNGDPANMNVSWHKNTTFNGTPGDDSVYANGGNSEPTAANGNELGSDPGLTLAKVKAMGAALTGSAAPAVPDVDSGGPQTPAPTTPPPSADLVGDNGGNTLYSKPGDKVLAGLGGADVFHFAGAWVSGTKVDTIVDLDFAEKDVIALRGYDPGTFAAPPGLGVFDGGRAATVDSLADLRALVAGSADVTSRSGGGGTEVLRIAQDGDVHEIRLDGYDHLL